MPTHTIFTLGVQLFLHNLTWIYDTCGSSWEKDYICKNLSGFLKLIENQIIEFHVFLIMIYVHYEMSRKRYFVNRWWNNWCLIEYFSSLLANYNIELFLIGIHSMQGCTAAMRHKVPRKRSIKRHIGNLFKRAYSEKVSVNSKM